MKRFGHLPMSKLAYQDPVFMESRVARPMGEGSGKADSGKFRRRISPRSSYRTGPEYIRLPLQDAPRADSPRSSRAVKTER